VGTAAAYVEDTKPSRRVATELHAVDAGAACACIGMQIGTHIAGDKTRAPALAETRVDTGDETAEAVRERGGIAVAIAAAPAAEPERREGEVARGAISRRLHRIGRRLR